MKNTGVKQWVTNNIKYYLVAISFVVLTGGLFAQEVWTLEDCIYYALDNNIQIKQSELTSSSYEEDVLQRKLDLIPSLNGSASSYFGYGRSLDQASNRYTTNNTQQNYFSLNSSVLLFQGFQKTNNIKKAQMDYMASKFDSDKMRDDISLLIAQSYLTILFSLELVETAEDQVDITNQQISRTQKLVNAGTLPKGDLLDVQSQGAREEVNLITAENQLTIAYLDLLQLLDMPAEKEIEIDIPSIDINYAPELLPTEAVYGYALENMPEIKSAEFRVESAKRSLAIAKGYRSPSLTMNGSYSTSYSDQIKDIMYDTTGFPVGVGDITPFHDQIKNNQNKTFSFGLSVPIFNGFQTSNFVNKSKIAAENAELNLELAENQLRKKVEQAYADAVAAYKSYNANLKSLEAFQEAFKYMEQKFNVGLVNALDYNVAKSQLTQAESNLISAKYDYVFKTKILDFYTGKPLSLNEFYSPEND